MRALERAGWIEARETVRVGARPERTVYQHTALGRAEFVFTATGDHPAIGHEGGTLLWIFQLNVLHNVLHLAIGGAMIAAAVAGVRSAAFANTVAGALYLLLFVAGLVVPADSGLNVIALNGADTGLHLLLGGPLFVIGVREVLTLRRAHAAT